MYGVAGAIYTPGFGPNKVLDKLKKPKLKSSKAALGAEGVTRIHKKADRL